MKKLFLALALAAFAAPASAVLQLSANINGFLFNCADQQICDTNAAVGTLQIANQTFNGVEILGSAQIQDIGDLNFLNTSSVQVINHNLAAATIILAVSGVDFTGPATEFSVSGSGTWQNAGGSTIQLLYYGDPANQQGADTPNDLPGLQLATFADVAGPIADAFAFNNNGPFAAGALFSMSIGTVGTLAAWNGIAGQEPTLVGRSQTMLVPQLVVPEPGTLALLALGLLAVGVTRVRRSR